LVQKNEVKFETSSVNTTKTAVPDRVDEEEDPKITVAGTGLLQLNDEDDSDNILSTKKEEVIGGFLA